MQWLWLWHPTLWPILLAPGTEEPHRLPAGPGLSLGGRSDPLGLLPSGPEGLSLARSYLISSVARQCITSRLQTLLNIPKCPGHKAAESHHSGHWCTGPQLPQNRASSSFPRAADTASLSSVSCWSCPNAAPPRSRLSLPPRKHCLQ